MSREIDWKNNNHEDAFHPISILTLVKFVSQYNSSLNNPAYTDWHLLGELELPAGVHTESEANAWLVEVFHPLHLNEDFLNRILKSIQAVGSGWRKEAGSVHLLVYSQSHRSERQTWGFFRIEKTGRKSPSGHTIELYLYREDP